MTDIYELAKAARDNPCDYESHGLPGKCMAWVWDRGFEQTEPEDDWVRKYGHCGMVK